MREIELNSTKSGIVFFDGYCGICNRYIDFLMTHDHNGTLRFASLQGKTAEAQLNKSDIEHVKTLIYKNGDKTYKKSDAALLSIASMGGAWKLCLVFRLVPRFIRDNVYSFISKNRYKWFGKKETCRMPTDAERDKLLD